MSNGFCGEIQRREDRDEGRQHDQHEAEHRQPVLAEVGDDAAERRLRRGATTGFEGGVGHVRAAFEADPRVEHRVEQIDHQVQQRRRRRR